MRSFMYRGKGFYEIGFEVKNIQEEREEKITTILIFFYNWKQ